MKRLIFLNRFIHPDHSATSQILTSLVFDLAASGRSVHVITSRQLYDDPQAGLPAEEIVREVHIHRVSSTQFGRAALLGRAIDYLSFYASMWRAVLAIVEPGDTLIAMTDPPLISILAMWAATRRGARLVNWLQDIYPEVAIELGVPLIKRISGGIASLRDQSLRAAAVNVVVGERMAERVRAGGVPPDRVRVIPNWTDDDEILPIGRKDNPLRREWGLENKFVVGYSGNLGRAHEFGTVLQAAERLRNHPDIVFAFIGGGHLLNELVRCVKERGLERTFRFLPYQERSALKYSMSVPDVHWISLRPELEGLVVPSKFFAAAAAGRPLIAIGARDGEIARLVQRHECGMVCEPGDGARLAEMLILLSKDAECAAALGARARAMLDAQFTRRQAFEAWHGVLDAT